jgi:uncharacterized membrane protein YbhN (UPF0104 family)
MTEPAAPSVQLLSRGLVRRLSIAMILGALAYGAALLFADAGALRACTKALTFGAVAFATSLTCTSFFVRFLRWAYYLKKLRITVGLGESALVFLAGFAMSITPAKLGEVLKALMLRESLEIPIARSAPIIIAERFSDVIGLLFLGGVGFSLLPDGGWFAVLALLGGLTLIAVAEWRPLAVALIRLVTRFRRARALRQKLLEAFDALSELLAPLELAVGTGLSVVSWGLQCLALAVVCRNFSGVSLSLPGAMVAYCAPLLAGTLAMIPGGLGLTEASMAGVISRFGGAGATLAVAFTITLTIRVITFWFAIALGFCALSLWRFRRAGRRPSLAAPTL